VVKLNYGFLSFLRKEVELFDSTSLDKAFLRDLEMERQVVSKPRNPNYQHPTNTSSAATPSPDTPWCTFHRTSTHATVDCRAIKYNHTQKTLYLNTASPSIPIPENVDPITLPNPTEPDPSLLLMTSTSFDLQPLTLFTHNCQIKHIVSTLILDNGSKKKLVS